GRLQDGYRRRDVLPAHPRHGDPGPDDPPGPAPRHPRRAVSPVRPPSVVARHLGGQRASRSWKSGATPMSLPQPTGPPVGAPTSTDAAADSGPLQVQLEFYRANSYLILPDLLSPEAVTELNAAMERDRAQRPYFWGALNSRNGTSNLLLTEPVFEP